MTFRIKKAKGALAIVMLAGATLLGVGCGGGDDGSERAVEWALAAPPGGPNWIRVAAQIEGCDRDPPLLEEPIIEYEDDRVYIELRRTPEDGSNLCFLNLVRGYKKITFERDLDELVIFDSSTHPPEQRWPLLERLPGDG